MGEGEPVAWFLAEGKKPAALPSDIREAGLVFDTENDSGSDHTDENSPQNAPSLEMVDL